MLMISVPLPDEGSLDGDGYACRINFTPTILTRRDGYLLYKDGGGVVQKCRIIDVFAESGLLRFAAASGGEENEPHVVMRPDGKVIVTHPQ